jgi:hypothetical protein
MKDTCVYPSAVRTLSLYDFTFSFGFLPLHCLNVIGGGAVQRVARVGGLENGSLHVPRSTGLS